MIDKISKFRKEIMGFAICLIIICHTTIYIEHARILQIYNLIRQLSKIGVDIFFLLSGLGLYFSFSNNHHILRFYQKRFLRIIPQYAIVVICWSFVAIGLSLESIGGFVWKYSLISFFVTGELAAWFVAAIILLYLLFPLFYYVIRKGKKHFLGLILPVYCLTFLITYRFSAGSPLRLVNEAFFVRIPTFLAGIAVGAKIKNSGKNYPSKHNTWIYAATALCIMMGVLNANSGLAYSRWNERVIFMPTTICIALALGDCLEVCGKRIRKILGFLGGMTLEIYLIHEKVLSVCDAYMPRNTLGSILSNFAAVVIAVFLAHCLSKITDSMIHKFSNLKKDSKRAAYDR